MEIPFNNQTVIVTGAARGIGRAIVKAFVTRGAHVHAVDILQDGVDETVDVIGTDAAGRLTPHHVDLADAVAVNALVKSINGGTIDVLVHAAGGIRGRTKTPIEDVSDDDWQAIMDANVTTSFNLARAIAPGMKAAGRGRLIFITSGAGLGVSLTGIQAYGTAKAAEIGLTRQLAAELGAFGITVNSIAPGFMKTSPDYIRQWDGYSPERQADIVDGIAMKRLGAPEDIAHAALFFASDYAGFITGQTLSVKGTP